MNNSLPKLYFIAILTLLVGCLTLWMVYRNSRLAVKLSDSEAASTLTIKSPSSAFPWANSVPQGSQQTIRWSGPIGTTADIYAVEGYNDIAIGKNLPSSLDSKFVWTVGKTIPSGMVVSGNNLKIKICVSTTEDCTVSTSTFSITTR